MNKEQIILEIAHFIVNIYLHLFPARHRHAPDDLSEDNREISDIQRNYVSV